MKSTYSNQPYFEQGHSQRNGYRSDDKRVSRSQWYYPVFNFTLIDLLQRLFAGLKRLFVAIKYQFYKKTRPMEMGRSRAATPAKWKIPWFRIGIIALVVFMFTQKDFQFSINMKAPQGGQSDGSTAYSENGESGQGMNIAQAISLNNNKRTKNKGASIASVQMNDADVEAYINRFRKVAIMEMYKFGIPASVKLAWGILESEAGQKAEAAIDNNHFGLLMQGQPFTTAWENWRAHSLSLKSQFPDLFEHGLNYKQWLKDLANTGVSNDQNFDKKMLNLIERYQLQQLDKESMQ